MGWSLDSIDSCRKSLDGPKKRRRYHGRNKDGLMASIKPHLVLLVYIFLKVVVRADGRGQLLQSLKYNKAGKLTLRESKLVLICCYVGLEL